MPDVIAEDGGHRQHRQSLRNLLETTTGPVRIASAYVTDRDLLVGVENRKIQVLTFLWPWDLPWEIVSGATTPASLRSLIETGVQCRCLSDGPRLHAKVYIFGEESAVVTSANLTGSGLDSNIEVGVQLIGSAVQELSAWFDAFWAKANDFDLTQVSKWQQETAALRREYKELRKKAGEEPAVPNEALPSSHSPTKLRDLLDSATRFFWCNTDREVVAPFDAMEERMHTEQCAAAWETFHRTSHMKRVKKGDLILMYANGGGIIAIGSAKEDEPEILQAGHPDRIRDFGDGKNWPEWRIPVEWLKWKKDDPCRWAVKPPLNLTFVEVPEEKFGGLREAVRRHFLG